MTVVATASNPRFTVSRVDVDRPGPTYTIDTLRDLRGRAPGRRAVLHHRCRRAGPDPVLEGRRRPVRPRAVHRRDPPRLRPLGGGAARRPGPAARGAGDVDLVDRLPGARAHRRTGLVPRPGRCRPVHRQARRSTSTVRWRRERRHPGPAAGRRAPRPPRGGAPAPGRHRPGARGRRLAAPGADPASAAGGRTACASSRRTGRSPGRPVTDQSPRPSRRLADPARRTRARRGGAARRRARRGAADLGRGLLHRSGAGPGALRRRRRTIPDAETWLGVVRVRRSRWARASVVGLRRASPPVPRPGLRRRPCKALASVWSPSCWSPDPRWRSRASSVTRGAPSPVAVQPHQRTMLVGLQTSQAIRASQAPKSLQPAVGRPAGGRRRLR